MKVAGRPHMTAWRITRIYLIIGSLWILFSDRVVEMLVADTTTFRTISHIKGWLYVWATATLFYRLIKASFDELDAAQRQLRHMALHDHLTDLPNRRALFQTLEDVLSDKGSHGVLFFTDLDNFKYINDSFGHDIGDELLTSLSVRLRQRLGSEWELFRLGGDEFVLLLKGVPEEKVEEYTKTLHDLIGEPFSLPAATVQVTCSTGIALYPKHGATAELLLKRADTAMNRAKEQRANSFAIFHESMEQAIVERLELDQALRTALVNNEFVLVYQPQYDLVSGNICGFEALLRWNRPDVCPISPSQFIPIAEQSGVIVEIGEWVLKSACQFLREVHALGHTEFTVSVNVSALELISPSYVDKVTRIVRDSELLPEHIELEITESTLMESNGLAESQLALLRARGFRIALDDFGTGYSSLNYLRRLPISTLKIDRSFLSDIASSEHQALVAEMIKIGKLMGVSVVAEGVEHPAQVEFLTEHQCDKVQGFLFCRPISQDELLEKLKV
jgi:diguanylate cyclase (GGDEF)-like protein